MSLVTKVLCFTQYAPNFLIAISPYFLSFPNFSVKPRDSVDFGEEFEVAYTNNLKHEAFQEF